MSQVQAQIGFGEVAAVGLVEELRQTRLFQSLDESEFASAIAAIVPLEQVQAPVGSVLSSPGDAPVCYWLVLSGQVILERQEQDGSRAVAATVDPGQGFGETPILLGRKQTVFLVTAQQPTTLVRFTCEGFWRLMAASPTARTLLQSDASDRVQAYQVEALHRERLVSLGTLAAGLMHELHNPGAAAVRSAARLRGNLMRLEKLSLRFSHQPHNEQQLDCVHRLLELALAERERIVLSSMEQADAEVRLADWLQGRGVENANRIAPALVDAGLDESQLACALQSFTAETFSIALNWLEALVSSAALVGSIEDSIERVTDLAASVKRFAVCDQVAEREVDIHQSLQSTLTLLDHKLRIKQIGIECSYRAKLATIASRGSVLGQVWTNLIDNAADASPAGSSIEIATFNKPGWLAVAITDHGAGIPAEVRPHMFEPFFSTKPQGVGTGLGLEIVHRIVTQNCGGMIEVESEPGRTTFTVWLPGSGSRP